MGITLDITELEFNVSFLKANEVINTRSLPIIKHEIADARNTAYYNEITNSTWQGINYATRKQDEYLQLGCFDWLKGWKNAPSYIIRDIFDLYCQTLNTKTFQLIRSAVPPPDTICRLCKSGNESVSHILNRCKVMLESAYLKRHNQVLKCFFNQMLLNYELIDTCPPWFSQNEMKPYYENDKACAWWDIPEFAEASTDNERKVRRPDGKLKLKHEKRIFIIEITISWIDNREQRYKEKSEKYEDIKRNIKRMEPDYDIDQITLVMDSLGGYSKTLKENISKVISSKKTMNKVLQQMQKAALSESVNISRRFKLSTQI